jgi:thiol:disulfide interchange protein DsbD
MSIFGLQMGAQIESPVKPNYTLSKKEIKKGDVVTLIFTLQLADHWHLYSNLQNYELGPLPTTFEFEPHPSYKLLEGMIPIGSKMEHEPIFDVDVHYFEKKAEFRQKIKICTDNPVIKGYYEYQICHVLEGKCLFRTDDFEFKIKTIN